MKSKIYFKKCKYCKEKVAKYYIQPKAMHLGLYCYYCDKWVKWVSSEEISNWGQFKNIQFRYDNKNVNVNEFIHKIYGSDYKSLAEYKLIKNDENITGLPF